MSAVMALLIFAALAVWRSPLAALRLATLRLSENSMARPHALNIIRQRINPGAKRQRDAQLVIDSLAAFEMELKAGQPPASALVRAAVIPPIWPAALSAVGIQGDVCQALNIDAQRYPELKNLAACWKVAAHSGSGMTTAVNRLIQGLRENEEMRNTLDAELASPRATAKVLSGLPLIGLLMGIAMGANPIGWLFGNPLGIACLICGLAFSCLGIFWSRRLVRSVEQRL
jgi:tight adherence protein B